MWPKILLELLPHLTRLVPAADKYLGNVSAGGKAQEAALAALAENVRGDLGQVAEDHAGLRRQLQEQNAQVAQLTVEVTRARMGVENVEERVAKLAKATATALKLLVLALVLLVGLSVVAAVLLLRLKAH